MLDSTGLAFRMDGQLNYIGATIFWLYIVAALCLTAVVVNTLLNISPTNLGASSQRQRNLTIFSVLAAFSFATLSVNMLNILIQSFNSWGAKRQHSGNIVVAIWEWSLTSTLFRDFGEAIVENSARYLWAENALLATLFVTIYMAAEGDFQRFPIVKRECQC